MAALAPSRPAPPLASLVRRRPSVVGRGGRDRLAAEGLERLFLPDGGDRVFPPAVRSASPAVAPSSTVSAVALPLARAATAEWEPSPLAEFGPADLALRVAKGPDRRFLLRGLALALLLHGAVVATLLATPTVPREGGEPEDVTVVTMVDPEAIDTIDKFAGVESATHTAPDAVAREPAPEPRVEPVAGEPAEAPPIAAPEPAPTMAAEVTPAEISLPVVAAPRAEDVVLPPPPPTAKSESPPIRVHEKTRPPAPSHKKSVRRAERTETTERTDTPPRAASTAGSAAVDTRAGGASGRAEARASGAGEVGSWRASVLAALARAKRYPEDARAQGRTGRASVTFTIRRDGSVVGIALASSSSVASLDGATLDMPRRAAFPPMPASAGAAQTFTTGVRYDLR